MTVSVSRANRLSFAFTSRTASFATWPTRTLDTTLLSILALGLLRPLSPLALEPETATG